MSSAVPYLQRLADIITISEHWLWPFELHTLNSLLPGYSAHGRSDKRLSESPTLSKNCRGVAILWTSSLSITPVTAVDSDRCVAVQVLLTTSSLFIVSVYLPTSDYPLEVYREYLNELESVILALQCDGLVLVTGDFNAHFGSRGGPRGVGDMNVHGQLLFDLMRHTDLFAASLCQISCSSSYTYFSGGHCTTVDYCLLDSHAACVLQECTTLDHHPLNLSDHLPISIHLDLSSLMQPPPVTTQNINSKRAKSDGSVALFQRSLNTTLPHSLSLRSTALSPAERTAILDQEICSGAAAILQAAKCSLPLFKPHKRKKRFIADTSLCI